MDITNIIQTVLARIIGSLVAGLATWLFSKYGLTIDQQQLSTGIMAVLMTVFGVVYSIVHRVISAHTNPIDAASPTVKSSVGHELKANRRLF